MLKPVEKPIKFVKNLSTKGKSYPITHVSAVIDDNGESVKSTIDSLKNKGSLTKVTWLELKNKRDAGKLIPGSLYRITDYQCTTTQENTQSAGHQFDIVLLALSEDKLAEEGWAMMNESNVYDVTFADGVTKKCWIYDNGNNPMAKYNIVDAVTLKGLVISMHTIEIDEEHKTAVVDLYYSDDLEDEGLTYDYFQNSNLSAWKVWYCLDNDKSRFAWADDKIRLKININGDVYITTGRDSVSDMGEYLYWGQYEDGAAAVYTKGTPKIGDSVYRWTGSPSSPIWSAIGIVEEIEIINGRGVIYRLIDEWGNDVPWDYKNILFTINDETTYSLNMADQDPDDEFDATLNGGTLGVIVNTTHGESEDGRTPKSIYPISRVMLQQCLIYLNEDVSPDSYLFTNNGHANIIYGLEIYDPNA